jgi:hypothetical protein
VPCCSTRELMSWVDQVLYSRFLFFKNLAASMANQPSKSTAATTASKDIKTSTIPQLAQLDERVGHAEHYYDLMLESCERLFDNEIDQHGFEEQMRSMFGYKVRFRSPSQPQASSTVRRRTHTVYSRLTRCWARSSNRCNSCYQTHGVTTYLNY